MNNNLQLVLKSSTTEMSLNDHDAGIYIVPELDGLTGLPEIRTTSGVNAGYDGGWTSAQKFDARSIVIRGVIANEDKTEVERMRRELVALLAQGKNEQLELDFVTETGRAYEVQVRTIACDMAMQRVLTQQEFMITLRADDPLIYDNSSAGEEATVNVSGATGGFRIPFEIPIAIDAGSEETVVQNSGLESVAPTIKMYGALHNPKIINHTTNQAMQVEAELGFTEGAWTTPVDAPEGTNVSFEPEREAPIESVKLKGDTYQKTYTGKNLFNLVTPDTNNGVTVTSNADGSFTINGTTTGVAVFNFQLPTPKPAGTYTISCTSKNQVMESGSFFIRARKADMTMLVPSLPPSQAQGNGSYYCEGTFTSTENMVYVALNLTVSGKTYNNMIIYPQVEAGGTATDWERYVGGVPAPNPDYPQAVQTVTGENVVKICGKNLAKLKDGTYSYAAAGQTWDIADGVIRATRTNATYQGGAVNIATGAIAQWAAACASDSHLTGSGGTYTLTFSRTGDITSSSSSRVCIYGFIYDDDGNNTSGNGQLLVDLSSQTSGTYTLNLAADRHLGALVFYSQFISYSDVELKVQLEIGSSASSFEPYQEQSYEVNLGKNLFDKDNVVQGIPQASDGSIGQTTGAGRTCQFIPVMPNTRYTHSGHPQGWAVIAYYRADKSFISRVGDVTTITTPSDCFYVSVSCAVDNLSTCQFELGSQATSYAAYFEPIELCKIGTYQDYIYKSGDKWYVRKAVDRKNFLGTTGWWLSGGGQGTNDTYQFAYYLGAIAVVENEGFSDKFDVVASWSNTRKPNELLFSGTSMYIRVASSLATTVAELETYLASNDIVVYYPLATPTDTEITNAALIEQLEALVDGNAIVYEGETNIAITAAAGNMPGIAAIRYYTDKEPDQRDELIIDSRLKTITLNGLDVYHLQAPGSEFLMLAPGENKLSLQSDITGDNGYAKVSYKQGYLSI